MISRSVSRGLRRMSWPWWSIGLGFGLLASVAAATPARCASAASNVVTVVIDQAKLMKLPEHSATLVIGNPLIADASLQPGGLMILTGKGYGSTNFVALDNKGKVLMQRAVRVQAPKESVSVYRGTERQSYSCTPNCERSVMLGDADASFSAILGQTSARNTQVQGASR